MEQYLDFSKSEVCQFVHEAVEQCLGSTSVHTELSLWGEVVRLLQGRQHVTGILLGTFTSTKDPMHMCMHVDSLHKLIITNQDASIRILLILSHS